MSKEEIKESYTVRDVKRFLFGFGEIKVGYDGNRKAVRDFYDNVEGATKMRGGFFEGKKATDIFIYAMCLGKTLEESLPYEKDPETKKIDRRATIDLKHFADQPEYVWMMVSTALADTKNSQGDPTMEIFREPKKIIEICEGYANAGIGELIKIANNASRDDMFRGYVHKLRQLIEENQN